MPKTFTARIAPHVEAQIALASAARREGRVSDEFAHLEAAHVLGQESTRWHVRVHVEMARWALRQKSMRELSGQTLRIVGAATKTIFGLVPIGNTGGTNISPFRRLPLSSSHEAIIKDAKEEG